MQKLIYLLPCLLFGSCTHHYYMPNIHNVPLFREKNEFRILYAQAQSDDTKSEEIQVAYSLTNHLAVLANGMKAYGGDKIDGGQGEYYEGAVGYFSPINEVKYAHFEVYGGYGQGNQKHTYNKYGIGTSALDFKQIFLQPAIGLSSKYFDAILAFRLSKLSFTKVQNNVLKEIGTSNYNFYTLDTIAQTKNYNFGETSLTVRVGWKYAKIQLQLNSSRNFLPQNNPYLKGYIPFEKGAISLGLQLAIAKRFWRREQKVDKKLF